MALQIKPFDDYLLVTPQEIGYKGKIVLPENHKARGGQLALVLESGGGRVMDDGTRRPNRAKAGDTILVPRHGGTVVPQSDPNASELRIIKDADVLALVVQGEQGGSSNGC